MSKVGNHFVHFECSNLPNYDQAKELVRTRPYEPDHTIEKICTLSNPPILIIVLLTHLGK
jgi:hypothetical protein